MNLIKNLMRNIQILEEVDIQADSLIFLNYIIYFSEEKLDIY